MAWATEKTTAINTQNPVITIMKITSSLGFVTSPARVRAAMASAPPNHAAAATPSTKTSRAPNRRFTASPT